MTKQVITVQELGKSAAEIVKNVRERGDFYVVSEVGKDDVVVVPRRVLFSEDESKKKLMEIFDRMSKGGDMTEDDAMNFALEEVAAARADRRGP